MKNLKELKDEFDNIVNNDNDLKIPILRKKDYAWLMRNLPIQNKDHPKFNQLMTLLRRINLLLFKQ